MDMKAKDPRGAGPVRDVLVVKGWRGSPNHVFFIYDGDDSDGVGAGPAGSDQIEKLFKSYYAGVGESWKGTDFSGRSDYGPFIAVGIPSGGLFTGAEGIKTPRSRTPTRPGR